MLIWHIFFGDKSVTSQFLTALFVWLLLSFKSSLHILDTSLLSAMCLETFPSSLYLVFSFFNSVVTDFNEGLLNFFPSQVTLSEAYLKTHCQT